VFCAQRKRWCAIAHSTADGPAGLPGACLATAGRT
jgi:hypothetical protein